MFAVESIPQGHILALGPTYFGKDFPHCGQKRSGMLTSCPHSGWFNRSSLSVRLDSIVPSDGKLKQSVFLLDSTADVVDYKRHASCCPPVTHNHDMRSVASDRAGNKISRQVIRWLLAQTHGIPAAFERGFQIGHTPVVDILVRPLQSPYRRVLRKCLFMSS